MSINYIRSKKYLKYWSKHTTPCQTITPANMELCLIPSSEGTEADQWDHCSLQKWGRCYNDFNRSQLSREWCRCIILDRIPLFAFVPTSLGKQTSAFSAQILYLKRLKLTWISVSLTMACCSAVLPTESWWNLSGTCINALSTYPCCSRVFCITDSKRESIVLLFHFIICLVNCTGQISFVHQLQYV